MSEQLRLVEAYDPDGVAAVRTLLEEYAASLDFNLCFQGFSAELAGLPGDYRPPEGRLYLAYVADQPVGCVALHRFEEGVAEMKRLYVRPQARGRGLGRVLAQTAIQAARALGYARLRLDTVPSMQAAIGLYESLGFVDVSAYRFNPVAGVRYLELSL